MGLLVAAFGITALALASKQIGPDRVATATAVSTAVGTAASAGALCAPSTLNRTAVLPGTSLAVSPLPDSYDASPHTQISLLGASPGALSAISVSGSRTGRASGHLTAYSQGDGASFVPVKPFDTGERVTVRGRLTIAAGKVQAFAFHFVVSDPDSFRYIPPTPIHPDPGEVQGFHSRPDLVPPSLVITARSPQTAPGYLFSSPNAGPGPDGSMIFDEAGKVVWFEPAPRGEEAFNLQAQQLEGKPVLTWWQGRVPPQGFGDGEEVILNSSYQLLEHVHAGNGFMADLHEFRITPQNTALLSVFDPIHCNLSAAGGPSDGAITDSIYQEVDLHTGLVRREWHSVDHVPLSESYSAARGTSNEWPFDFFHLNSIDQLPSGRTLISARNTWTLYELNTLTGQVLLRVGGKHSDVKLASGTATAFQHDATLLENGTISVFDNGAVPKVHSQSRGLVVSVNPQTKTDTLVAQFEHPTPLSAGSLGSSQQLANGDMFLGWGSKPYFSEFSALGQLLFDGHMHGSYQSYRTYRFPWVGTPSTAPAISAVPGTSAVTVYASWNGATLLTGWRVLAGPSPTQLAPVATAPRSGFETAITIPLPAPYVEVQALDASGTVIRSSAAIKPG